MVQNENSSYIFQWMVIIFSVMIALKVYMRAMVSLPIDLVDKGQMYLKSVCTACNANYFTFLCRVFVFGTLIALCIDDTSLGSKVIVKYT